MNKLQFILLPLFIAPVAVQGSSYKLFSISLKELLRVKVIGFTQSEEILKFVPSAVVVFTKNKIIRWNFIWI